MGRKLAEYNYPRQVKLLGFLLGSTVSQYRPVICPRNLDVTLLEFCCEEREQQNMRKSRFSEEQIINILREADGGQTVDAVCARHNLSKATFYGWKKKFGGLDVSEARRLRALEEENGRLKRLVADQAVQIQILKEVNSKKW